jgi:nucleoside-diphosphate-sugar epimerase
MTRVLVTGASGFVGRQALGALVARGFEVHGATWDSPGPALGGVRWHSADLLRPGDAERLVREIRPTHLLHLAWFVRPGAFWRAPDNVAWVEASLRLVRAFAAAGGRRLVIAGTCAEYDWAYGRCIEGETPLAPSTLYGAAKHGLRTVVEAYAREAGLSAAWGRLFLLYGPHEPPGRLVSSVAGALLRGEPAPCTHGEQVRDFLHVADAGDAFAALLESAVEGAVNVASGEPTAVKDLVAAIADAVGRPDLLRWGALPTRADEPPMLVADVTRLTREVGWRPRFSLRTGAADTVSWWRAQLRAEREARRAALSEPLPAPTWTEAPPA